jgi:uncharacterized protein YjbI with pentapeptide repeats
MPFVLLRFVEKANWLADKIELSKRPEYGFFSVREIAHISFVLALAAILIGAWNLAVSCHRREGADRTFQRAAACFATIALAIAGVYAAGLGWGVSAPARAGFELLLRDATSRQSIDRNRALAYHVPKTFAAFATGVVIDLEALAAATTAVDTGGPLVRTRQLPALADERPRNCELPAVPASGQTFAGAVRAGNDFRRDFLAAADFTSALLAGADFTRADLRKALFRNAVLLAPEQPQAEPRRQQIEPVNPAAQTSAAFLAAKFNGANIQGADFRAAIGASAEHLARAANWPLADYDDPVALDLFAGAKLIERGEAACLDPLRKALARRSLRPFRAARAAGENACAPATIPDVRAAIRADLRFANLADFDIGNVSFAESHLYCADLRRAKLERVGFERANIWDTDFRDARGVDFAEIKKARNWIYARFNEAQLKELGLPSDHYKLIVSGDLTGHKFEGAAGKALSLELVWFTGKTRFCPEAGAGALRFVSFSGSQMNAVKFDRCALEGVQFNEIDGFFDVIAGRAVKTRAELQDASFAGARLKNTSFIGARLVGGRFDGATLEAKTSFERAGLSRARFAGAQFREVPNFTGANLADADLETAVTVPRATAKALCAALNKGFNAAKAKLPRACR